MQCILSFFDRRQAASPGSPASLTSHPVSLLSSADLSPSVQGTTLIQLQQCVAVTPQKGNRRYILKENVCFLIPCEN